MADPITTFVDKAPTFMGLLIKDFGFDELDAAAIMGNFGHESNGLTAFQEIDPIGGGRGGWGWAQWTGDRRKAFEAYCERNGLDPRSDKANYAWVFNELKGAESGAVAKTKAAQGLEAKVKAFELAYERAHKDYKHYDSRLRWAERALDAYQAAGTVPEPAPEPEPQVTFGDAAQDFMKAHGLDEVAIVCRRK